MGPGKILSGIKDVTEKVLVTASQFVVDGPPDIRWYGRKIFHMLMSHDEFDRLLVRYLNETTRKNIKEILDTIRVKVIILQPNTIFNLTIRMSSSNSIWQF